MVIELTADQENQLSGLHISEIVGKVEDLNRGLRSVRADTTAAWTKWRDLSDRVEFMQAQVAFLKKRLQDEL